MFDESPDNEFAGPTQRYFQDSGSSQFVKRQYEGTISSVVFAIPDPQVNGQWLMYTVVMKDRDYRPIDLDQNYDPGNTGVANPIPEGLPRVFQVQAPLPDFNNVTLQGYGGGDLTLVEQNQPPRSHPVIRDGDWFMLINGTDNVDTTTPELQNIQNLNFYRVIEAEDADAAGQIPCDNGWPRFSVYRWCEPTPDRSFAHELYATVYRHLRDPVAECHRRLRAHHPCRIDFQIPKLTLPTCRCPS